tara:strand:- start:238 stop:699 length:462 start_codon:yes stop_codon:yes gene_type:complete
MNKKNIGFTNIISLSILIVLLDQISKHLASINLKDSNTITIIPDIIRLRLAKNTGAAFSLFSQNTDLLTILSIIISILLIFWLWKKKPIPIRKGIAIGFLLAGSIGNGIDRLIFSYVTDFIEFIPLNFPIFNIADISINIALAILIFDSYKNS